MGVNTLSWMDWKSALSGSDALGPLEPKPIGLPLASSPMPFPAQPPSSVAAVHSVATASTYLGRDKGFAMGFLAHNAAFVRK
jgi:hypothetical protein